MENTQDPQQLFTIEKPIITFRVPKKGEKFGFNKSKIFSKKMDLSQSMTISQSYDVISSKSQTTISAASLTNVPLLIAVKTTNTEEYTVNPRIFILDPFEKQEIKIDCCKVNITRKKDKFLFTGYELTKEDANSKVENIYKRIKAYSSQYKSYSVKREVQFEELSEKEIEEKDNIDSFRDSLFSSFISEAKQNKLADSTTILRSSNNQKEEQGFSNYESSESRKLKHLNAEYNKLKQDYDELKKQYDEIKPQYDELKEKAEKGYLPVIKEKIEQYKLIVYPVAIILAIILIIRFFRRK